MTCRLLMSIHNNIGSSALPKKQLNVIEAKKRPLEHSSGRHGRRMTCMANFNELADEILVHITPVPARVPPYGGLPLAQMHKKVKLGHQLPHPLPLR